MEIAMKRLLAILPIALLLAVSCIEEPDIHKEDPVVSDPVMDVSCKLEGSYSVRLVCTVGRTSRIFIGGGFYYATDPGFGNAQKAPGMVIDNRLECTVTDLVPATVYYVKAYMYDVHGSIESEATGFESLSFIVPQSDFQLKYTGGTVIVDITSRTGFRIECDAEWISEGSLDISGDTYRQLFNVAANSDLYARSATIKLTSPDAYFRKEISVSQDGAPLRIPDAAFQKYLLGQYDADGSGGIELEELPSVTEINVETDAIASLDGIQNFPNLKTLVCRGVDEGSLGGVDLSGNPGLVTIDLSNNHLASLDVSCCPDLKSLRCSRNRLTELDLSGNEPLEYLDCSDNFLTAFDLSGNYSLRTLCCSGNSMGEFVSPRSSALETLDCSRNALEALNLALNSGLRQLDCSSNRLAELSLGYNTALESLDCSSNLLETLPLRRNEALESLTCTGNGIKSLDLRFNGALRFIDCSSNLLKTLDLSGNTLLETLKCSGNFFQSLDVSMLGRLALLECECDGMRSVLMDRAQNPAVIINPYTAIRYTDEMTDIADPVFRQYLLEYFDADGDGRLSVIEAELITSLNIDADNVRTLEGISSLSGLKYLKCEGSLDARGKPQGLLTSLDLSGNHLLEQVLCGRNRISSLDVSGCPNLRTLWCFDNRLGALDLSGCPELTDLNCERNLIEELHLETNGKLVSLDCSPMTDEKGLNLLRELHLSNVRIDYVNGWQRKRNISCVPPGTMIYMEGIPQAAFHTSFMFNYNAKDFSPETRTFYNVAGAEWPNDMTLEGNGFTYHGDYVTIDEGTFAGFIFPSPDRNPFNRRNNDDLTIIAKVKGTSKQRFSIFACRRDDYCYMFREGDGSTKYFYLHDARSYSGGATNIKVQTLPNIVAARASNGRVRLESWTDDIKGEEQGVWWGGLSDAIYLFYGGVSDEYWNGDFYWIFLSLNALSDEEIMNVISYNEI